MQVLDCYIPQDNEKGITLNQAGQLVQKSRCVRSLYPRCSVRGSPGAETLTSRPSTGKCSHGCVRDETVHFAAATD
jgi:hypothetical protein